MCLPLTRRNLIIGGALLGTSGSRGSAGRALSQTATKPSLPSIRLGVASYTFRKFDRQALIAFMKELKTPYLNVKDMHLPMAPVEQIATSAAAYRSVGVVLSACGAVGFTSPDEEDIRSKFEYCKLAGIKVMVCAPTREVLPRLEKFVKQYDIRLAIHNHGPEDKEFPSPLNVLSAVESMDARIGCCVDVGHTMRTGTDVPSALREAGSRLFDIHMKDLANATEKESQVAVGDGIMPVHAIFQTLIDIQYHGNVDLEYEIFPESPMPGVTKSFAFMRGVLAGMATTV